MWIFSNATFLIGTQNMTTKSMGDAKGWAHDDENGKLDVLAGFNVRHSGDT